MRLASRNLCTSVPIAAERVGATRADRYCRTRKELVRATIRVAVRGTQRVGVNRYREKTLFCRNSRADRCTPCGLRSAVGCKPREAVLYPDTVAGANPKVGPYCSSRWLLEGLWLMQRSESRRATHMKGSSSRAAADGGPPRSRHLSVRPVTVARGSTARAYQDRPEGIMSQASRTLACSLKPLRAEER